VEKSRENQAFAMTSGNNNREFSEKNQAALPNSKLSKMAVPT